MTWALGDNQARAFVGNIKAEKIAQGAQVIWTRVAAKNPSGVANSNTETQLSWTDDSGIELQFVIERALDAAFTVDLTTLTVGPNQQSLIDNALSHNTTYYYRIKGDYPAGQVSDFSDVITITTLNLVAPPTPVSATGTSNSSISLAWIDNSNNEDGFKIERSTSATGPFTEIADLPSDATSYNDVGLTYDTTYHYRIIGYNTDDTSAPAVLGATTTNDLLSPSGLTVTPISNSVIELNWQDNTVNEDGFKIARSTDGINYTDIDTVGPDVVTYTDTGLTFNTTYHYQVRGYNTSGDSNTVDGSATTTNSLSAPTNLVTTSITNTSIGLQWTDNSINEDGFTINGFDADNSMQSIGSVNLPAGTTSYTWGSLVTDNSYSFQVIATNSSGSSSALSGSFTTTDTLSDITGFSATAASNSTISLSWTDTSDNEDGFKIARSTDGINYTDIDTLNSGATTYTDTGLTFNTTYHYQVRSFNTSGDSNTATDSATTTNSLSAPSNLTAVPTSNTTISLSWTDTSNNEDGFTLQRATGNGAYGPLADLAANTTSFSDTNLTANYTYHYQIRGYNSDATSSFTTVTVTTLDDLTAPTITSATVVSHEQVDISFTDTNTNEDSFELEFSSDGGNTYASATNSLTSPQTSATYSHIGLTQATTYQWRIRAKNTSGVSSWSTAVSATTQAGMNAPQVISASQVNTSIQISFQDNTLIEDSFTVERSSTSSTAGFSNIAHLAANSTSYTNNYNTAAANLTAGTTYYYRVKADSSQYGDSPYSNVTAVAFNPLAATTTATSNFVGQNDLGFDFAETTGQTMPAAGFSTFHYELATDSNFSSIAKTISSPTLLASVAFSDLSPDTTYYARLRITGLLDTSVGSAGSSGAIITDPCSSASISIADDGDSTQTVTVTGARPNSLITISEYATSSGIRGSFSTLADDEQGDPFLGIIRSAAPNGGKITVDGGMLKYVGYLPPAIVPTYGDGTSWSSHSAGINIGGDPQWTTTEESFLAGGGSIYDSSNIPAQWSFLYNNINFLSRSTNKTNKILYINDYKNGISGSSPFPYYGAHKFYHGFKYISEHAGYTFEQLPVNTGAGNTWLHHDAIENLHSTTQQWTDYFNNYDLIIYVGVNGETNGHSSSIAYLPQAFIDGFLNFIDGGGGSYMTTDHAPVFPVAINQILSYYGIFATGNFTRTGSDPAYKISSMLADQTYIPQGWHPLFSGLDVNSSILAGTSEAIIEYNTGQDTTNYPILSTTSNHTADASGNATITSHSAGVSIGYGEVFAFTADGCGVSGIPAGATTTWEETGLTEPPTSSVSNSTSLQAVTTNTGDTDEDTYTDGVITSSAYSYRPGTVKSVGTGPYEQFITGEWYHIAFSQDDRRVVMWVNGLPVAVHTSWHKGSGSQTNTYSPRYSYDASRFGAVRWGVGASQHSSWSIDNCFNGVIDQPVFFDSPIFQNDVDEMYNGSNGLISTGWSSGLLNKVKYKAEFTGAFSGFNIPSGAAVGTYGYKNELNPSGNIVGAPSGFTLRVSGPNSGRHNNQKVFQVGTGKVSSSGYHPFQSDMNLHNPGPNDYTKTQVWDELNGLTNYGRGADPLYGSTTSTTKFRTQLAFPSDMSDLHVGGSWGFSAWFKREGEGPSKSMALYMANDSYWNTYQRGVGSNILTCYPYPFSAMAAGNPETTIYQHYRVSA